MDIGMLLTYVFFAVVTTAVFGALIFITVDAYVNFRLSTWLAKGHWKWSPAAHIDAHKQRKLKKARKAAKLKRTEETRAIERYYSERSLERKKDNAYWLREFNDLNRQEHELAERDMLFASKQVYPYKQVYSYDTSRYYSNIVCGRENRKMYEEMLYWHLSAQN